MLAAKLRVIFAYIDTRRLIWRLLAEAFTRGFKNSTKFPGKQLFQSHFFIEVAGLSMQLYQKKRLLHRCFPVTFVKFVRAPFLQNTPRWLLLYWLISLLSTLKADNILIQYFISLSHRSFHSTNYAKLFWLFWKKKLMNKYFLGNISLLCERQR